MQRLINLVVRFKEIITFTALVVISLSLMSIGDMSRLGGFRAITIGTVGWLQELFAWVPNPGALQAENKAVRELNIQLFSEVTRSRQALIENQKLRNMLDFLEETELEHISAEVVGRTTIELRSFITLNKGIESGIEKGMSVRTDAGLVGVIMGSSKNYSLVELILNRNVRISGKIQRTGISGIISWEGGDNLFLKNIPESYDVQEGDVVITSNFSNKYPPNLPIGQIVSIDDDLGSLFQKITVKPYVSFQTLEEVFVIKSQPDPERNKLINEMEERMQALKGERVR